MPSDAFDPLPGYPSNANQGVSAFNDYGDVIIGTAMPGATGHYTPAEAFLVAAENPAANGIPLGSLGGGATYTYGMNNNDEVVGASSTAQDKSLEAFLWSEDNGMISLGTLSGSQSEAWDINNSGQIVINVYLESGIHAFRMSPGETLEQADDLGSLGSSSFARKINDIGQVVGTSTINLPGVTKEYVFRTAPNAPIDPATDNLGTLPGSNRATPNDINNRGDVVGTSYMTSGGSRAFLVAGNTMYDLNDLIDPSSGWILQSAGSINDSGEITVTGILNGGRYSQGALLIPIPEPESGAVISLAIAGALAHRRKRTQHR